MYIYIYKHYRIYIRVTMFSSALEITYSSIQIQIVFGATTSVEYGAVSTSLLGSEGPEYCRNTRVQHNSGLLWLFTARGRDSRQLQNNAKGNYLSLLHTQVIST